MTKADLSGKYLHDVLADGSRNFRYRNRVRALLGLPTSEGVKVSFGSVLSNMMNFAYTHPQFTQEYYLPDKASDKPARDITYIEDEFLNLPPMHPGSNLQRAKPTQNVPERKPHFTDRSVDQALNKAESRPTDANDHTYQITQESKPPGMTSYIPSSFQANPLNLPNVTVRKAITDRPKIEEHQNIQIPGSSKNETQHPAEIQLPSNPGNERTVNIQAESRSSLRQDEFPNVGEVKGQSRRTLPTIQPTQTSAMPVQTASSSLPNQTPLSYLRPQTKRIQSQEWTEESLEEQGQSIDFPQLPSRKVQPANKTAVHIPSLSVTPSESKLNQPPASSPNDTPVPVQPVTVLWRGSESKPKNFAFWERRHLSHLRLRLLR